LPWAGLWSPHVRALTYDVRRERAGLLQERIGRSTAQPESGPACQWSWVDLAEDVIAHATPPARRRSLYRALCVGDGPQRANTEGPGNGVNATLWRAQQSVLLGALGDGPTSALREAGGVELPGAGDEAGLGIAVRLQESVGEGGGGLQEAASSIGQAVQEDAGDCRGVRVGLEGQRPRPACRRIDPVDTEGTMSGRPSSRTRSWDGCAAMSGTRVTLACARPLAADLLPEAPSGSVSAPRSRLQRRPPHRPPCPAES
jgi:hypothetical protein